MKLQLPSGMQYGYDAQGKRICVGSQMGRGNQLPKNSNASPKLRLAKLRMCGDYDQGGAYWGHTPGTAIYCAWGEWGMPKFEPVMIFTRATSREEAKADVLEILPNAHFYR